MEVSGLRRLKGANDRLGMSRKESSRSTRTAAALVGGPRFQARILLEHPSQSRSLVG